MREVKPYAFPVRERRTYIEHSVDVDRKVSPWKVDQLWKGKKASFEECSELSDDESARSRTVSAPPVPKQPAPKVVRGKLKAKKEVTEKSVKTTGKALKEAKAVIQLVTQEKKGKKSAERKRKGRQALA